MKHSILALVMILAVGSIASAKPAQEIIGAQSEQKTVKASDSLEDSKSYEVFSRRRVHR